MKCETLGPKDLRSVLYTRNFALGIALECLWQLGASFIVPSTIQVGFLSRLAASEIVIGAFMAMPPAAMCIVPLLSSHVFNDPRNYKKVLIALHLLYVLPWGLVGALILLGGSIASLLIPVFFLCAATAAIAMAAIMPLWFDYLTTQVIPPGKKGQFFGSTVAAGSLFGVAGAYLSRYVLRLIPFPNNFACCFLIFCIMGSLSVAALAFVRGGKTPNGPEAVEALRLHFRRLGTLLRLNLNLRWFLAASIFIASAAVAANFFGVYSIRAFGVPPEALGSYSVFIIAGQFLSSALLGRLGDRVGYRPAYSCAVLSYLASVAIILLSRSAATLYLVFFLYGGYLGYSWIGPAAILTDMAQENEIRLYLASYYALINLFLVATPLVNGFLIELLGYRPTLLLSMAMGITGLAIFLLQGPSPRLAGRGRRPSPPRNPRAG